MVPRTVQLTGPLALAPRLLSGGTRRPCPGKAACNRMRCRRWLVFGRVSMPRTQAGAARLHRLRQAHRHPVVACGREGAAGAAQGGAQEPESESAACIFASAGAQGPRIRQGRRNARDAGVIT